MQIDIPDDIQTQAVAAGFATIQDYVIELVERDSEKVAIQHAIDEWKSGRLQSFEDVDRALRQDFGFSNIT